MAERTVLVIGATGDVGQGIVRAVLGRRWTAIAAGRSMDRLAETFAGQPGSDRLHLCAGSLESEESTAALWEAASTAAGSVDTVVVSVNAPQRVVPLAELPAPELADLLGANLVTHFNAAKVLRPRLPASGLYLGIGGGMADLVIPGNVHASIVQAGLRMMYRGFAREQKDGAALRELMIVSMVNGQKKRAVARPEWVTDDDIGAHVCAIIAAPDLFPGPILQLRSRDQAGQPDNPEGTPQP